MANTGYYPTPTECPKLASLAYACANIGPCNSLGVITSLAEAMREELGNVDTDTRNTHPAVRIVLAHLTYLAITGLSRDTAEHWAQFDKWSKGELVEC